MMKKIYYAEITDRFPGLEGKVRFGPYATREEAEKAIDEEMECAKQQFSHGDYYLSGQVKVCV